MISIQGLNKAAVLAVLYNASRPLGMGFLHYDPSPMTVEEAQKILETTKDFDYLKGRVMKVNLSEDEFTPHLYDRDNGQGAAERAVNTLRGQPADLDQIHRMGVQDAAATALQATQQETEFEGGTVTLGLAGVKSELEPLIFKALK